jgi:iron complex transport system ATP-binding protein
VNDVSDVSDVPVFAARGLRFRYPGGDRDAVGGGDRNAAGGDRNAAGGDRDAVGGADLRVDAAEFVALLGPNGSGKSTLLRLLLGALQPYAGTVLFQGRPLGEWPRAELARRIGVVTQAEEMPFPLTVRELVAMGRYPHLGAWRREGPADRAAIRRALEWCGVAEFETRSVLELSGGERQRARLARALAQEARILVLDEPTAALDMAHEMALFEMMAGLSADGATIIAVTHNINVAARYARRLVLLDHGAIVADGAPDAVLTQPAVESVYQWPVAIRREDAAPQVVPLRSTPTRNRHA